MTLVAAPERTGVHDRGAVALASLGLVDLDVVDERHRPFGAQPQRRRPAASPTQRREERACPGDSRPVRNQLAHLLPGSARAAASSDIPAAASSAGVGHPRSPPGSRRTRPASSGAARAARSRRSRRRGPAPCSWPAGRSPAGDQRGAARRRPDGGRRPIMPGALLAGDGDECRQQLGGAVGLVEVEIAEPRARHPAAEPQRPAHDRVAVDDVESAEIGLAALPSLLDDRACLLGRGPRSCAAPVGRPAVDGPPAVRRGLVGWHVTELEHVVM